MLAKAISNEDQVYSLRDKVSSLSRRGEAKHQHKRKSDLERHCMGLACLVAAVVSVWFTRPYEANS
jgi:hypothetical protein